MTEKLIEVPCVSVLLTAEVELRPAAHPSPSDGFSMEPSGPSPAIEFHSELLESTPMFLDSHHRGRAGFPVLPCEKTSGIVL